MPQMECSLDNNSKRTTIWNYALIASKVVVFDSSVSFDCLVSYMKKKRQKRNKIGKKTHNYIGKQSKETLHIESMLNILRWCLVFAFLQVAIMCILLQVPQHISTAAQYTYIRTYVRRYACKSIWSSVQLWLRSKDFGYNCQNCCHNRPRQIAIEGNHDEWWIYKSEQQFFNSFLCTNSCKSLNGFGQTSKYLIVKATSIIRKHNLLLLLNIDIHMTDNLCLRVCVHLCLCVYVQLI